MTDEEQAYVLIQRAKDEVGRGHPHTDASVVQLSKIEKGLSDEWCTVFYMNASFTWHNLGFFIIISADGGEEVWVEIKGRVR